MCVFFGERATQQPQTKYYSIPVCCVNRKPDLFTFSIWYKYIGLNQDGFTPNHEVLLGARSAMF
jgi:hypothetical protein